MQVGWQVSLVGGFVPGGVPAQGAGDAVTARVLVPLLQALHAPTSHCVQTQDGACGFVGLPVQPLGPMVQEWPDPQPLQVQVHGIGQVSLLSGSAPGGVPVHPGGSFETDRVFVPALQGLHGPGSHAVQGFPQVAGRLAGGLAPGGLPEQGCGDFSTLRVCVPLAQAPHGPGFHAVQAGGGGGGGGGGHCEPVSFGFVAVSQFPGVPPPVWYVQLLMHVGVQLVDAQVGGGGGGGLFPPQFAPCCDGTGPGLPPEHMRGVFEQLTRPMSHWHAQPVQSTGGGGGGGGGGGVLENVVEQVVSVLQPYGARQYQKAML